ncbi:MAG TPA: hypothetical protein ENK07_00215, partial [Bacteroidetes bacterium]|nr:hypothetical protein [Bacteroidota bacterium]
MSWKGTTSSNRNLLFAALGRFAQTLSEATLRAAGAPRVPQAVGFALVWLALLPGVQHSLAADQAGLNWRWRHAGVPYTLYFSPRDYGAHSQNWAVVQDPWGVIYV